MYKTVGVRQKHLEEVFDVPFQHDSICRLQAHFQDRQCLQTALPAGARLRRLQLSTTEVSKESYPASSSPLNQHDRCIAQGHVPRLKSQAACHGC